MVRTGELKAPIVIGRDHLDAGSVASPNRETEAMRDGTDAVSDWPLLNLMLNTASGATWVSFHHGGGVGMGYSQHAGMVIVCDGTEAAAKRIERVLWNDPASGVLRHADAGYAEAIACAAEKGWSCPCSDEDRRRPFDLAALRRIAREGPALELDPACLPALRAGFESVERIVASGKPAYGINTGFGRLSQTRIPDDELGRLQTNIVLSHAAGTGPLLDDATVRLVLALKILALASGHRACAAARRAPARAL